MSDGRDGSSTPVHFLDTVEGEIALFRAIAHARPVGIHKHFHMISILRSIKNETGRTVTAEDVWEKLGTLYNLEQLDENELSGDEIDENGDPEKDVNYHSHPRFKNGEFTLDHGIFDELIAPRRKADIESEPEAPASTMSHTRRASQSIDHSRKGSTSKASAAPQVEMFDSEGELTEEEDAGDAESTSAAQRKGTRSRSDPASVGGGEAEDVEMANAEEDEPALSPAASVATRSGRGRAVAAASAPTTAAPKKRGGRQGGRTTTSTTTRRDRKKK